MDATTITIRIPLDIWAKLEEKAGAKGQSVAEYVEALVVEYATRPTLAEILAPFRAEVEQSGITDDELDALVESERQAMWEETHGKKSDKVSVA